MGRKFVTRSAAVLLALGVVSPVTAVVVSGGSAFAAGGQVSCAKLKGTETSQALSKCTGPLDIVGGTKAGKGTGTSATAVAPSGYSEGETITWGASGGGTSYVGVNYTEGTGCPGKDLTIDESATVISGTGAATALTGDTTTGVVCVNVKKGSIQNEKGTTANF